MIVNNLLPVFVLIAAGYVLKRADLINASFTHVSDGLIYYLFFPLLLFWKIGGSSADGMLQWPLYKAVIFTVLSIYAISIAVLKIFAISRFKSGAFSQSCYRFNTYVGMALILNVTGEEGVRQFGILISLTIPVINVLAVSTLIWFSDDPQGRGPVFRTTFTALISNPLIIACLAGMITSKIISGFPVVVDNLLRLATSLTLPLALLSIGSAITFRTVRENLYASFLSVILKCMITPLIGFALLRYFSVTGTAFIIGMIFFALPTSSAIYVLSAQLGSDRRYAASAIMVSTVFSFISLSIVLELFVK
ncbi:MAG: AEC family transporter [Desulfobacteraceae bacterium]|nr:AEC family transporter [Desulfobacteraceae bacterium]